MSRSPRDRIADIRAAIAAIREAERLGRDLGVVFDAVQFRLITIGEAVKSLPQSLLDTEPSIRWSEIARFRDRAAHRYFDTAHSLVWAAVDNDLDPLLAALDRIEAGLSDTDNASTT